MTEPSRHDTAVVAHEPSLGRPARVGTWQELARGTFRSAAEAFTQARHEHAAALVEVSLLEAQELRQIYQSWPESTAAWIIDQGVDPLVLDVELARLGDLIGADAMVGIEAGWPAYVAAADHAIDACRAADLGAPAAIEAARAAWQLIHDQAVDRVSGLIDIAVRTVGEARLIDLWDFLMSDWYVIHAARYGLDHQSWDDSAHQLMIAIVDGFHAHLTGVSRQGDIELIQEDDRIGFRFAPCGSGGRSLDPAITDEAPRAGAPFSFAVTTEPHDWAWNKVGVCSYCVHCCLLNEVMPIDRLGYPTRVIDAPTWPDSTRDATCTWWVYKHPSLIPDEVYTRVGRDASRRPARLTEATR